MDAAAPLITARFARVRSAFHALVELDSSAREKQLKVLAAEDASCAAELRSLLARLDDSDLQAATAQAEPTRYGPFQIVTRIARGGMGEVFLAERVEGGFEQRVALKLVQQTWASADINRRFARERQILAALSHPNIAHLVDGGISGDGRPWLAMEFVEGARISDWCATRGLDVAARVRLLLPLCAAVQFAHASLVVHRDLKPANIMVDNHGRPKLLDFGIARLLHDPSSELTQTALVMTPAYAAPEQRAGGAITTATDIYQMGVVIRELAVSVPSEPRGDLLRIIEKATADTPAARYASISTLADDLADWLDQRPPRSGIGSRRERLRKTLWQWRWPLGATAGVLLALALGGSAALYQSLRAQQEAELADANFRGMLDVLGALDPEDYLGPDPSFSDALNAAALRLQRQYQDQPAMLWRALGTIGRTFVNRHRSDLALPLLRATEAAIARDPLASDAQRFDFAVMRYSVDVPATADEQANELLRIGKLAAEVDAERAIAEIAATSYGMALYGHLEAAAGLANVVDASARSELLPPSLAWKYWNARGEIAWRSGQADKTHDALRRMSQLLDTQKNAFLPAQRIHLARWHAEHGLDSGDVVGAVEYLASADALLPELADAAVQRDLIALSRVRLKLLTGDFFQAAADIAELIPRLEAGRAQRHASAELREAWWLSAQTNAALGRCEASAAARDSALALLSAGASRVPRYARMAEKVQANVAACATKPID